jgi:hypothetical protein
MDELEPFVTALNNEGFIAELSREDSIPFLCICHRDYRVMTIAVACELARRLNSIGAGVVRFHTLEGRAVNFFVFVEYRDDMDTYGVDIDIWLAGVLAGLPQAS